jgi:phosphate transport system substrate-binding protein
MYLLRNLIATFTIATAFFAASSAHAELKYSGSDTLEPVIVAAQFSFLRGNPNFKMSSSHGGSSIGLRDLCSGKAALVGSSRPINASEAALCAGAGVNATELPVAYDPVAVVVSSKNTWLKDLTLAELSTVFSPASVGKITSWKQVRATFPDVPIHAAGVGIKHATFDFFSKSLGLNGFIRSDYKDFKDHESTAKYVATDLGGIGFVSEAEARTLEGQVQTIGIDFGKGITRPSLEDVAASKYDKLTRTVYLYVNAPMIAKSDALDIAFTKYLLKDMEQLVKFVNLTPLRTLQYQENSRRLTLQ